ncbi:cardiolipin synthase [Aliiglaciecola lipolytica]|uniref:Cardiolipin synthase n=1 Tax=Aliiglaciecola lipolytica E3 TaxID=1127673 RepID=K6XW32_9ALTE|nr:cardiolipin synthase [Aliiglaciecola lipolytica]GAC15841.1 cardiolipin synthase [Aliiglaciecola lipolytica E3]
MHLFEELINWLQINRVTIVIVFHFSLSFITSLHVILYKENERTSLAWIGLVIFSPFVGSLFYWLFGINRIERTAQKKHPQIRKQKLRPDGKSVEFHEIPKNWHSAVISGYKIHPVNYVPNNKIEPLVNGDEAYPEMIRAVEDANTYVVLSSYIFDYDSLGIKFIKALSEAQLRGVVVKVLLDGVGIGNSWRKSHRALKKSGVKSARFLPTFSFTSFRFINLRNHRKILCVDGEVAFIGGMNVSKRNLVKRAKHPIDDVHFKVTGPVIDQISHVFKEDWFFATEELIEFPSYVANSKEHAPDHCVVSRVVQDGPDENHRKIRWVLISALGCAQKSVKIMTPYFVPDHTLLTCLHAAALRGVSIEIIVPEKSDFVVLNWVMEANYARIMEHGIKIYKNKRPFDHSKIAIIDEAWSFIGSTNWDARSLDLNFEINLECFDSELNENLTKFFHSKKQNATRVNMKDLENVPFYKKVRNNLVRLMSPYL